MKLQYLVSNYDVDFMDAEFAAWRASMVAWWAAEEKDFTSHGSGMFQWMKQDGGWKINGITQKFYGMRGHLSS